jgi:hypothetical protein
LIAAALVAVGYASWFTPYQRVYDGGYYCAMPSRSMIRRRVRVVAGKRHQTCRVIGTGPFVPGRVIDVSPLVRDDLHMLQPGVISVKVYLLP